MGLDVRVMKPISAGGRGDGKLLRACEGGGRSLDRVNPWHFTLPASPYAAARADGRRVTLEVVKRRIFQEALACDGLLVEGIGGLMVPLASGVLVSDLINGLNCRKVLVAASNRLGVLNHILLTVNGLSEAMRSRTTVVLMGTKKRTDSVTADNFQVLKRFLAKGVTVAELPWMGAGMDKMGRIRGANKKFQKTLASLCDVANLLSLFEGKRL